MRIDEWENGGYLRIQNNSDLVKGISDLGEKALIYNGLIPVENVKYRCLRPQNKEIRIPARFSSSATCHDDNIISKGDFPPGEYSLNGFYGHSLNDSNICNKSEILSFTPRLYVQLQKLSDFIADIGLNNHFHEKPLFNTPTISNSYGYKYDRITNIPENAYVLRSYSIYTNNTNGDKQTLLHSYDYTPKSVTSPELYDTFVPCSVLGGYSGAAYVSYMRSLLPHYYTTPGNPSNYRGTAPLYVGINGIISDKINGVVNMVSVSGNENFSENPFMNVVIDGYFQDYWSVLTVAPTGEGIYYIAGDLATWKQLFTASGMPWTDNIDDVIAPDDSNLNKPTTPGQPSNPVHDKDGDGDNISDTVEYPDVTYIPNSYTKYWITPDELVKLKEFLFKKTFLDNVSRLWENPAEYIVDLTYYPLRPDTLKMTGAQEQIIVGNINSEVTGLIFPDSGNRFHYMGAYHVEPYYNSYLDYEPYTSISIYLPYIGVRSLDSSRVTGHTLNVGYTFDFNTRQVTAHLGLDGQGFGDLGNALDSFTGSFGVAFPLSGSQANQVALNVLQSTTQLISSAGAIAGGVATGNVAAVYGGAVNAGSTLLGGQAIKPESLGTLTPTAGLYAPQIPYLIINRPITALPSTWAADMGYSAGYSGKVSSFTGYLEALHVELNRAANMTEQEAQEIITALQGGILI